MDGRLIVYALWAAGSVLAWGVVFRDDLADVRRERRARRPDRRRPSAFTQLLSDLALLLVAIASAISIVTLIIGQDVPGLRGFAIATALGGFLGAGIVKASLRGRS